MSESVLDTTKAILNIDLSISEFDAVLIVHINSAFANLHQIGICPGDKPFKVATKDTTWEAFIADLTEIDMVKSWLSQKVRLIFDPPATSFGISSVERVIQEFEYRMSLMENLFVTT